jgi:hypothetical protein
MTRVQATPKDTSRLGGILDSMAALGSRPGRGRLAPRRVRIGSRGSPDVPVRRRPGSAESSVLKMRAEVCQSRQVTATADAKHDNVSGEQIEQAVSGLMQVDHPLEQAWARQVNYRFDLLYSMRNEHAVPNPPDLVGPAIRTNSNCVMETTFRP